MKNNTSEENKKGGAKKGVVTGIRENIEEDSEKDYKVTEDIHVRYIRIGQEKWKIFTLYSPQNKGKEIWGNLLRIIEEPELENILIMGDMNARIGEEGKRIDLDEDKEIVRRSEDKIINSAGRIMLEALEQRSWVVLNGNVNGDLNGNLTFHGVGSTVIDYMIMNYEAMEKVKSMEVVNRVESSHALLKLSLEEEVEAQGEQKTEIVYQVWDEEAINVFKEQSRKIEYNKYEIDEMMDEWANKVSEATTSKKIVLTEETKKVQNGWWDSECKKMKSQLNKILRNKRRGKTNVIQIKETRKKYKDLCREKKITKQKEVKDEIKLAKRGKDIWEFINKFRGKERDRAPESIKINEWRNYFMKLLDGEELVEKSNRVKLQESITAELSEEDILRQLKKLKKKKAAGEDSIRNEALIYMEGNTKNRWMTIIKEVWRKKKIPDKWRKAIVTPVFKKRE